MSLGGLVLVLATLVFPPQDVSAAETKLLEQVAAKWRALADWAVKRDYAEAASAAMAQARSVGVDAPLPEDWQQRLDSIEEAKPTDRSMQSRIGRFQKDIAKVYDRLASIDGDETAEARRHEYLLRAAELDASRTRVARVEERIRELAANPKTTTLACILLLRFHDIDAEVAAATERDLAQQDAVLIRGEDHDMVGFLSLPADWEADETFPILVAVDGAGCNFLGCARNFARQRGERDDIVLSPCSLANTNKLNAAKYPFYEPELLAEWNEKRIEFDLSGLQSLLAVIQDRFGGDELIGITGFSGGGNLCYAFTMLHSEQVEYAAPACANFFQLGVQDAEPLVDGGPPVLVMTGEKDPHREFTHGNENSPGIEPQTDLVMQWFEDLQFTDVERKILAGVGHSSCARQVWEFADRVRAR